MLVNFIQLGAKVICKLGPGGTTTYRKRGDRRVTIADMILSDSLYDAITHIEAEVSFVGSTGDKAYFTWTGGELYLDRCNAGVYGSFKSSSAEVADSIWQLCLKAQEVKPLCDVAGFDHQKVLVVSSDGGKVKNSSLVIPTRENSYEYDMFISMLVSYMHKWGGWGGCNSKLGTINSLFLSYRSQMNYELGGWLGATPNGLISRLHLVGDPDVKRLVRTDNLALLYTAITWLLFSRNTNHDELAGIKEKLLTVRSLPDLPASNDI